MIEPLAAAIREARDMDSALSRLGAQMRSVRHVGLADLRRLATAVRWDWAPPTRRQALVAGMIGRYYVRGGLHPAHASRDGIDRLVQAILQGAADDECGLMRPTERAACAAAALRGWTQHRG